MWLLILEACGAMGVLVFIVWWTMFSGQKPAPPAPKALPADKTQDGQPKD